jgi:hypothetical protein
VYAWRNLLIKYHTRIGRPPDQAGGQWRAWVLLKDLEIL